MLKLGTDAAVDGALEVFEVDLELGGAADVAKQDIGEEWLIFARGTMGGANVFKESIRAGGGFADVIAMGVFHGGLFLWFMGRWDQAARGSAAARRRRSSQYSAKRDGITVSRALEACSKVAALRPLPHCSWTSLAAR